MELCITATANLASEKSHRNIGNWYTNALDEQTMKFALQTDMKSGLFVPWTFLQMVEDWKD